MPKQLFLLRHAKSDWSTHVVDFDRPLNERGKKDSFLVGKYLNIYNLSPDFISSSPSERTRETIVNICSELELAPSSISWNDELYHADSHTLLAEATKLLKQHDTLMLVSHNPGLDDLLKYLCPETESMRSPHGKLMTTATIAQIEFPDSFEELKLYSGKLVKLIRPEDIGN